MDGNRVVDPTARIGYFRAIASDFDGTMTSTGTVSDEVVAALADVRATGLAVVLVTGRIIDELLAVEPRITGLVDAVVGENGCVLLRGGRRRLLARPVGSALAERLTARGVAHRCGEALVACSAADELAVLAEVRALGEDHQLVRNRGELMVLPAGVTKGTGIAAALADLGLSPHSAIAVGDAENDHALFEACELGVAVADAVESLRSAADLVVVGASGAGVVELLRSGLPGGTTRLPPRRWTVGLGDDDAGVEVSLPASQVNVLIAGPSSSGKSYAAGLFTEELVRDGYTVLVVDPEGDHHGLGRLPGTVVFGGDESLVPPDVVARLLRPQCSVVVDLSALGGDAQAEYLRVLHSEVEAHRIRTGLPHWVVADEAQRTVGEVGTVGPIFDTAIKGHVFVTWRAHEMPPDALASVDAVLVFGPATGTSSAVEVAAAVGEVSRAEVSAAIADGVGRAVLVRRDRPGRMRLVEVSGRSTEHVRHSEKYGGRSLVEHRFHLWDPPGESRAVSVSNLVELEVAIGSCAQATLVHHGSGGHFSQWIRDVVGEPQLATQVEALEAQLATATPTGPAVEATRLALVALLQEHRAT